MQLFDRIHLCSQWAPGFWFLEDFLEDFYSHFQFLPGLVFVDCTFVRIYPFLLDCPLYLLLVAYSSLMILCIYVESVVISHFLFLILLNWALSLFFLMSLAKDLSILLIFSKNQLLVSLISLLFCLYFIYFCSVLCEYFPSANFGLCLFFLL